MHAEAGSERSVGNVLLKLSDAEPFLFLHLFFNCPSFLFSFAGFVFSVEGMWCNPTESRARKQVCLEMFGTVEFFVNSLAIHVFTTAMILNVN